MRCKAVLLPKNLRLLFFYQTIVIINVIFLISCNNLSKIEGSWVACINDEYYETHIFSDYYYTFWSYDIYHESYSPIIRKYIIKNDSMFDVDVIIESNRTFIYSLHKIKEDKMLLYNGTDSILFQRISKTPIVDSSFSRDSSLLNSYINKFKKRHENSNCFNKFKDYFPETNKNPINLDTIKFNIDDLIEDLSP